MGVREMHDDLTTMAHAAGVLTDYRHRPPLEHISPSAACSHGTEDDDAEGIEIDEPALTWANLARAVLCIVTFWAAYVAVWAIFGGAA